jgi:hypothetical protein
MGINILLDFLKAIFNKTICKHTNSRKICRFFVTGDFFIMSQVEE